MPDAHEHLFQILYKTDKLLPAVKHCVVCDTSWPLDSGSVEDVKAHEAAFEFNQHLAKKLQFDMVVIAELEKLTKRKLTL